MQQTDLYFIYIFMIPTNIPLNSLDAIELHMTGESETLEISKLASPTYNVKIVSLRKFQGSGNPSTQT